MKKCGILKTDNNGRNALFWFAENVPLRRKLSKSSKETIAKLSQPRSSDERHIQVRSQYFRLENFCSRESVLTSKTKMDIQ
jgi:hypothetical protein